MESLMLIIKKDRLAGKDLYHLLTSSYSSSLMFQSTAANQKIMIFVRDRI